MQAQTVHLYVFDGMADWEPAFAIAGINNPRFQREPGRFRIATVGCTAAPITTMGGVRVQPDLDIDDLLPTSSAMLILPGGDAWESGGNQEAIEKAAEFLAMGIPVAAICAATLALARAGFLDNRLHTSNAPDYLRATGYRGHSLYRRIPAIADGTSSLHPELRLSISRIRFSGCSSYTRRKRSTRGMRCSAMATRRNSKRWPALPHSRVSPAAPARRAARFLHYTLSMALEFTTSYIEDSRALFAYYKKLGERAMDQVSDEQLIATLDYEGNSIAAIVKHMAGNMRSRWTDFLTSDGEKPDRNRDSEFEEPPATRAELLAIWEAGWSCLYSALQPLSDADLTRTVTIRGEKHSVMQAINRQLAHYPHHVGQIVLLAKHFAGERWQTLSVPRKGSAEFNRKVGVGEASQR